MEALYIPMMALALPALYFILQSRQLRALRIRLQQSWANLDAELERRYALILKLAEALQASGAPDKEAVDQLLLMRKRCAANTGPVTEQASDEQHLVEALRRLLGIAESQSQLKADPRFLELQQELVATEHSIQAARRDYNSMAREYQKKCNRFPSSVVAGMLNLPGVQFFTVPPAVAGVPNVDFPGSGRARL
jgi:LemA protein